MLRSVLGCHMDACAAGVGQYCLPTVFADAREEIDDCVSMRCTVAGTRSCTGTRTVQYATLTRTVLYGISVN